MEQPHDLTARGAAAALGELREARGDIHYRAAGLSLMMWGLVIFSMVGSLLLIDKIPHEEFEHAWGWPLFLLGNIATVAAWAAVGARLQNVLWDSFSIARGARGEAWKEPLKAFGVAFALVLLNLPLQGVTRTLQGLDESSSMADIHHNLAFAFGLSIGGAVVAAVTMFLGARGFARRPGFVAAAAMMLGGHLTTFLWFPDLGAAGAVVAVLSVPLLFFALGSQFWRRG